MKINAISFVFVLLALPSTSIVGQGFEPIKSHRFTAGSLGVANAVTSIASHTSAFYFNPAGISRHSEYRLVSASPRFIESADNFGVQAAVIDGKTEDPLHWGFSYNFARSESVARFHDFVLGTSYNFNNRVLIGVGQRLTNFDRRALTPEKWTYGINAGALVFVTDHIAFGASFDNFVRSNESAITNPVIFRSGVSANFERFRIGLDAERDQSNTKTTGRMGGEWQATQLMQSRAGFFSDTAQKDIGYTLGLGFKPSEIFQLNLAFMDQLKSSVMIYVTDVVFKF